MPTDGHPSTQADPDLLDLVERFTLLLAGAGTSRMAARVFAYVLVEDADRYTARELAEGLGVSPAAISGAVRTLVNAGLVRRGREPGQRSDYYEIDGTDVWPAIFRQRLPLMRHWEELARDGTRCIGIDTRGGQRLRETQAFYRFMGRELEAIVARWHSAKDEVLAEIAAEEDAAQER